MSTLRWSDCDSTPNGWSINSEQIRGERRLYFVENMPTGARRAADVLGLDLASTSKATVKRRCQRVQDELDAEHCVPE